MSQRRFKSCPRYHVSAGQRPGVPSRGAGPQPFVRRLSAELAAIRRNRADELGLERQGRQLGLAAGLLGSLPLRRRLPSPRQVSIELSSHAIFAAGSVVA